MEGGKVVGVVGVVVVGLAGTVGGGFEERGLATEEVVEIFMGGEAA